jgi:hypothetical protein
VGSFIIGLDIDEPGIGERIAEVANHYGVDYLNMLFLMPLPGSGLDLESKTRALPERDWPLSQPFWTRSGFGHHLVTNSFKILRK